MIRWPFVVVVVVVVVVAVVVAVLIGHNSRRRVVSFTVRRFADCQKTQWLNNNYSNFRKKFF